MENMSKGFKYEGESAGIFSTSKKTNTISNTSTGSYLASLINFNLVNTTITI